jgi:hypothetical protein
MGTIFSKQTTPLLKENVVETTNNVIINRSVKKYKNNKIVIQPNAFDIFERPPKILQTVHEHEIENYPESPREESTKVYDNHSLQHITYLSGTDFYDLKKMGQENVFVTDDIIVRKTHSKIMIHSSASASTLS